MDFSAIRNSDYATIPHGGIHSFHPFSEPAVITDRDYSDYYGDYYRDFLMIFQVILIVIFLVNHYNDQNNYSD